MWYNLLMKTRSDIENLLKERKIGYSVIEHPAVFTMEEIDAYDLPHKELIAKNLFLRDDKKRSYYLLTMRGDLSVNLKEFKNKAGTRALSFASEEDLNKKLSLFKGEVTPFGILNDEKNEVHVFIDTYFKDNSIYVHPNDNSASLLLKTEDLISILKDHGNEVEYIDM